MVKPRQFVAVSECVDNNTSPQQKHTVVVVGLWEAKKVLKTKSISNNGNTLICKIPTKEYTLTLGRAICHPEDTFVKEVGVELALKRIKRGDSIGKITTENYTMLTGNTCQAIVNSKAEYMAENITKYIPTEVTAQVEG